MKNRKKLILGISFLIFILLSITVYHFTSNTLPLSGDLQKATLKYCGDSTQYNPLLQVCHQNRYGTHVLCPVSRPSLCFLRDCYDPRHYKCVDDKIKFK